MRTELTYRRFIAAFLTIAMPLAAHSAGDEQAQPRPEGATKKVPAMGTFYVVKIKEFNRAYTYFVMDPASLAATNAAFRTEGKLIAAAYRAAEKKWKKSHTGKERKFPLSIPKARTTSVSRRYTKKEPAEDLRAERAGKSKKKDLKPLKKQALAAFVTELNTLVAKDKEYKESLKKGAAPRKRTERPDSNNRPSGDIPIL